METEKVKEVLAFAKNFLSKNDLTPSLQCFCFSRNRVTAYNDMQGYSAPIDINIEGIIQGDLLVKLLNSLVTSAFTLEVSGNKSAKSCQVVAGNTKSRIPIRDIKEYSDFSAYTEIRNKIEVNTDEFIKGLKQCLISTLNTNDSSYLTGVACSITPLENSKGRITLYSSDRKSISQVKLKEYNFTGTEVKVVLPKLFCESLDKKIAKLKVSKESEVETISLLFGKNFIKVVFPDSSELFSKVIVTDNSVFSNYERYLDKYVYSQNIADTTQIIDLKIAIGITEEFISEIERACLLYNFHVNKQIKTKIYFKNNVFILETTDDIYSSKFEIPLVSKVDDLEIVINSDLFYKVLKLVNVAVFDKTVTIFLSEDSSFIHIIANILE
jgi:hypothetical protein